MVPPKCPFPWVPPWVPPKVCGYHQGLPLGSPDLPPEVPPLAKKKEKRNRKKKKLVMWGDAEVPPRYMGAPCVVPQDCPPLFAL